MMDNTMSACTKPGNTRFKESENPEWTRRTANVSPSLVKPLVKAKKETQRILNRLEEVATHKKEPNHRDTLRKGRWRFKDHDFVTLEPNLHNYKVSYKMADKVLPKDFDVSLFPKR